MNTINFSWVVNNRVPYLHLYPKTGCELDHNHYVIPCEDEMCIELKLKIDDQGNETIKATIETLTEQELGQYEKNTLDLSVSVEVAEIFRKMANMYSYVKSARASEKMRRYFVEGVTLVHKKIPAEIFSDYFPDPPKWDSDE